PTRSNSPARPSPPPARQFTRDADARVRTARAPFAGTGTRCNGLSSWRPRGLRPYEFALRSLAGPVQLSKPVREDVVGAVEVGAQAAGCDGPCLPASACVSGCAEELTVDADEEPCGDARVSFAS